MAHFKKLLKKKKEGKITFGDGIIDNIVLLAMAEVPYAELYHKSTNTKEPYSAIKVDFEKAGVNIDVYVKVHYSQCVSDMAFKIQETIRHNVENMTDYHIASVNVYVKGLMMDEISPIVDPAKNNEETTSNSSAEKPNDKPIEEVPSKAEEIEKVKESK